MNEGSVDKNKISRERARKQFQKADASWAPEFQPLPEIWRRGSKNRKEPFCHKIRNAIAKLVIKTK